MAASDYHFVTHWKVRARAQDVFELIRDVPRYRQWWGEVYLDVQPTDDGYRFLTRGRLPYKLRWQSRTTNVTPNESIQVEGRGDLRGQGLWTIRQAGEFVDIQFDWRVAADKPLIRTLSFLFKPIFAANHRWAMARGEEGLRREIVRRAAVS